MKLLTTQIGITIAAFSAISVKSQMTPIRYEKKENLTGNVQYIKELSSRPDSTFTFSKTKDIFKSYNADASNPKTAYQKAAKVFFYNAYYLQEKIDRKYEVYKDSITNKMSNASLTIDAIDDLNDQLHKLDGKKKDELVMVAKFKSLGKEMLYRDRRDNNVFWFPVRNETDAQLYYENSTNDKRSKFLQNTLIRFTPDGGKASIYNEVFADYASFLRIGIGVMISNKDNSESTQNSFTKDSLIQKDAVQRLIGGGGNFIANIGYPIYDFATLSERFSTKLSFAPKVHLDVPKIGTEKSDYAFSTDIGFEGSTFYTLKNEVITLFANYRFGWVTGNKIFFKNLLKNDNTAFLFNQLSFGLALGSAFRINWNLFYGDKFIKENFKQSIGFSVIP